MAPSDRSVMNDPKVAYSDWPERSRSAPSPQRPTGTHRSVAQSAQPAIVRSQSLNMNIPHPPTNR
eukprot:1004478-Prorocentrum_minimum.AAC.1